jgi:hypothetical protein
MAPTAERPVAKAQLVRVRTTAASAALAAPVEKEAPAVADAASNLSLSANMFSLGGSGLGGSGGGTSASGNCTSGDNGVIGQTLVMP